jgi:hypothetical protein
MPTERFKLLHSSNVIELKMQDATSLEREREREAIPKKMAI